MKIYIPLLLFVVGVFASNSTTSQADLNEQFKKYVSSELQKKCDGLGDICKKFYIGYFLLSNAKQSNLSLKYLVESYEKNATKIVDNFEAKEYYLTETIARLYEQKSDLDNAEKFFKLSVKADNKRAICYLSDIYHKQGKIRKSFEAAKDGASQHFSECYTNLGMYYFNDEFGIKDKELGGEYWKKAYWDNSYRSIENYNLGVYYEYKKDNLKSKFYTLKAANLGDKDAKRYLESNLQKISTTKLFLEEALGSEYWDVEKRQNREFSNYDLHYRLKKMYNQDSRWIENHEYRDKRWDENRDNVVKFEKGLSSLIFEDKKLILQTTINRYNRNEILSKDIELLYEVLLVDLSGAKDVVNLHHELVGRLTQNKSFKYSREFNLYGYTFLWYAKYDKITKNLRIEIQIV